MNTVNQLADQMGNILESTLRSIVDTADDNFRPYDRYGVDIPGMSWLPLSLDSATSLDLFLLRFEAGAQSMPHEHMAVEQFFMLEGTLTDCDGHEFKPGDFLRFEPGSKHHSRSENGCLMLVILQDTNRRLDDD